MTKDLKGKKPCNCCDGEGEIKDRTGDVEICKCCNGRGFRVGGELLVDIKLKNPLCIKLPERTEKGYEFEMECGKDGCERRIKRVDKWIQPISFLAECTCGWSETIKVV